MGISIKEQAIDCVVQVRYAIRQHGNKWIVIHKESGERATLSNFHNEGEAYRWTFKHVAQNELAAVDFCINELKKSR